MPCLPPGVQRIIITATNLKEAREALKLARTDGADVMYSMQSRQHLGYMLAAPQNFIKILHYGDSWWCCALMVLHVPACRAAVLHRRRAPNPLL